MNIKVRAKQLRKAMTKEEVKLWLQLKHFNKRGCHFRRQSPVDGYILDFVDFSQRFNIEVDGSQHSEPSEGRHDRVRDHDFTSTGFRVLRFWNFQINPEMDGVIDAIENALKEPPPPASPPPPP